MNTTLSLRVDEQTKKKFLAISKAKGIDGSALLRYFMEQFTKNPDIVKFEIEEDFFDQAIKNNKIKTKLEKISDKLDELWF